MNYRIALPTLALSARSFTVTAGAQAQQKKPASSAPSARPAAATTTAPAQAPTFPSQSAPKPVTSASAPESVANSPASGKAGAAPEKKGTTPTGDRARFGVQGGMAAPMSSLGQAYTVGYAAGVFLEGRPAAFPVGLRGDLQYASFGVKNGVPSPSFTVLQLSGAAVYDFPSGNGGKSPFFATGESASIVTRDQVRARRTSARTSDSGSTSVRCTSRPSWKVDSTSTTTSRISVSRLVFTSSRQSRYSARGVDQQAPQSNPVG